MFSIQACEVEEGEGAIWLGFGRRTRSYKCLESSVAQRIGSPASLFLAWEDLAELCLSAFTFGPMDMLDDTTYSMRDYQSKNERFPGTIQVLV